MRVRNKRRSTGGALALGAAAAIVTGLAVWMYLAGALEASARTASLPPDACLFAIF